jgi:membrane protease YdiL (CAAX protease family)
MNSVFPMTPMTSEVPSLREDFKLALVLGLLAALATAAVFPYLLEIMPAVLAKIHVPLPLLILAQSAQAGLLLTALSLIGLRLGHRVGLGSPWLRALVTGRLLERFPWALSVACGLAAGLTMIGLSLLTDPYLPEPLHGSPPMAAGASALNGFLASFYGGIGEELQLRLFLMTLIVWIMAKFAKSTPSDKTYWIAITIAALLFGAGHLPAAAQLWPLTSMVIVRTVVLNAAGGVVFGWLYWRRGLEAAMLGHFSADLVLHVLVPALSGLVK